MLFPKLGHECSPGRLISAIAPPPATATGHRSNHYLPMTAYGLADIML